MGSQFKIRGIQPGQEYSRTLITTPRSRPVTLEQALRWVDFFKGEGFNAITLEKRDDAWKSIELEGAA